MKIVQLVETAKDTQEKLSTIPLEKRKAQDESHLSCIITIKPEEEKHSFDGFGGAITESVGYVLSKLDPSQKQDILHSYYGDKKEGGLQYSLGRTHMNSCDFSLENWSCLETKDLSLESFSMKRPDVYITPVLQDIKHILDSRKTEFNLMLTPWSPPSWMKDNEDMNHGGSLLPEYRQLWAEYFLKYIKELEKRQIPVWMISIQNEPAAVQTWDSCIWTGEEEGIFATQYLGPLLEKEGKSHIGILVWDHNRDLLLQRMTESMSLENSSKYIQGVAFHWYSGDQYDNVKQVSEKWPDKKRIFSEGCVEGGPRNGAWFTGERYAHNIINDLNSGCTAWIDWNLVLNTQGGPNHVGNYCDAPILVDTTTKEIFYQSSFYYIGHFSRYIPQGAKIIETSMDSWMVPANVDGRMGNTMECCATNNPDGTVTLVVCNRTESDMKYKLVTKGNKSEILFCPPRGIQTIILSL